MMQKKAIGATPVERVVFNEITKNAILDAMQNPREINTELVDAYLARRALIILAWHLARALAETARRTFGGARSICCPEADL